VRQDFDDRMGDARRTSSRVLPGEARDHLQRRHMRNGTNEQLFAMHPWQIGMANRHGSFERRRRPIFIEPTTQVYEGMLIGENSRTNDLDVNICREKKQTNMRSSGADEAIRLVPPHIMGLEVAIEFINDDELVEVTPKSIRLRKRILAQNMRPKKADV
jgi:predicted membrane GTPase involved in stress response